MSPYLVLALSIGIITGWLIRKKQTSEQFNRLRRRAQRYRLALEKKNVLEHRQSDSYVLASSDNNSSGEAIELYTEDDLTLTFNESEALVQVQQELQQQLLLDDENKRIARIQAQERGKAHALLEMHKKRVHELHTTLSQQKRRMRAMADKVEALENKNGEAQKDKSLAAHRLKFASLLQSRLSKQTKELQIFINKVEVFEEDRAEKIATITQLQNQLTILARQLDLSSSAQEKTKQLTQQLAQKEGELAKFSTTVKELDSSRRCVVELSAKLERNQQTLSDQQIELEKNKTQAIRIDELVKKHKQKEHEILQLQFVTEELELSQKEIQKLRVEVQQLASKEKQIAQNDIELRRLKSESIALRRQRNAATQKSEALQKNMDQQSKAIDHTLQLELRVRQLEPLEMQLKQRDARIIELSQRLKATNKNTLVKTAQGRVTSIESLCEVAD